MLCSFCWVFFVFFILYIYIYIFFLCVTLWLCWIICTDLFFWVFNIFHSLSWVLLKRWQEVDKLNLFPLFLKRYTFSLLWTVKELFLSRAELLWYQTLYEIRVIYSVCVCVCFMKLYFVKVWVILSLCSNICIWGLYICNYFHQCSSSFVVYSPLSLMYCLSAIKSLDLLYNSILQS